MLFSQEGDEATQKGLQCIDVLNNFVPQTALSCRGPGGIDKGVSARYAKVARAAPIRSGAVNGDICARLVYVKQSPARSNTVKHNGFNTSSFKTPRSPARSCLLPAVSHQRPPHRCLLPAASSQLPPPSCILPAASSQLPPPSCLLPAILFP